MATVTQEIAYCNCTSLVKALFDMQFLPSGPLLPKAAVHFSLLEFVYISKMVQQGSNHGFAEIFSIINRGEVKVNTRQVTLFLIYIKG